VHRLNDGPTDMESCMQAKLINQAPEQRCFLFFDSHEDGLRVLDLESRRSEPVPADKQAGVRLLSPARTDA
jgi:hypothetical protein